MLQNPEASGEVRFRTEIRQATDSAPTNYALNAVAVIPPPGEEFDNGLLVATNSRILAVIEGKMNLNLPALIPRSVLPTERGDRETVRIRGLECERQIEGGWIGSKQPEGNFPLFDLVLPELEGKHWLKLTIDPNLLLQLYRALAPIGKSAGPMTLLLDRSQDEVQTPIVALVSVTPERQAIGIMMPMVDSETAKYFPDVLAFAREFIDRIQRFMKRAKTKFRR